MFVKYNDWVPLHACLPSVHLASLHVMTPRPSPSALHTKSDQNLELRKAWEIG